MRPFYWSDANGDASTTYTLSVVAYDFAGTPYNLPDATVTGTTQATVNLDIGLRDAVQNANGDSVAASGITWSVESSAGCRAEMGQVSVDQTTVNLAPSSPPDTSGEETNTGAPPPPPVCDLYFGC